MIASIQKSHRRTFAYSVANNSIPTCPRGRSARYYIRAAIITIVFFFFNTRAPCRYRDNGVWPLVCIFVATKRIIIHIRARVYTTYTSCPNRISFCLFLGRGQTEKSAHVSTAGVYVDTAADKCRNRYVVTYLRAANKIDFRIPRRAFDVSI